MLAPTCICNGLFLCNCLCIFIPGKRRKKRWGVGGSPAGPDLSSSSGLSWKSSPASKPSHESQNIDPGLGSHRTPPADGGWTTPHPRLSKGHSTIIVNVRNGGAPVRLYYHWSMRTANLLPTLWKGERGLTHQWKLLMKKLLPDLCLRSCVIAELSLSHSNTMVHQTQWRVKVRWVCNVQLQESPWKNASDIWYYVKQCFAPLLDTSSTTAVGNWAYLCLYPIEYNWISHYCVPYILKAKKFAEPLFQ